MTIEPKVVEGRLVLDDVVATGRITIGDERIVTVELDETLSPDGPIIAPGFVDVHVHGWGGHDAMGDVHALDGMSEALLRHGITSFLPTGVTAPIPVLHAFAERVRAWIPTAPGDGAQPLGFNLEGPFLSEARRGAHDPTFLRDPAGLEADQLEPLLEGLRLITIAPEIPGALGLIERLRGTGIRVSLGHSAADIETARAGYAAGATSTTHLFNAMSGVEHRSPGLAVAALTDEDVYVELIADGEHVHRALWPLITRLKGVDRLLLVSDAIPMAGIGDGPASVGGLDIVVAGRRVTLAGTTTLAGSVIALDDAVRELVAVGVGLPAAVAAASRNPLAMLGVTDRGRLAAGQRADLVELDDDLVVRGVMRAGRWFRAN